jgi:hypothetical protein
MSAEDLCWQSNYWERSITELEALEREETSDDSETFQMSAILGMLDPIETIPEAEDL